MNYMDQIQFEGATWKALKHYLEQAREKKVKLLVSSDTHDESNRIRGAIQMLEQLIALDKPTAQSANRGN